MKIALIVGTRPNLMKAFPVYNALKASHSLYIIHTGQHYDDKMSKAILDQLGFPEPNVRFNLTSKTRAGILDEKLYINNQVYLKDRDKIIKELTDLDGSLLGQLGEIRDKILIEIQKENPDLVIVFGDVTSTLAGAIAAHTLKKKIAHIESGLRSFDLGMPEEINRIITDYITSYYFVTEQSGIDNLHRESLDKGHIYLVGNTMIDSLYLFRQKIKDLAYHHKLGLFPRSYVVVTLHRPGNVDDPKKLGQILRQIRELSIKNDYKIIFPIHPRTRTHFRGLEIISEIVNEQRVILLDPLPYFEFISLVLNAKYVVTDSGGIQEETSALGVPCFTLRSNTERPSTLVFFGGTNQLIDSIDSLTFDEGINYKTIFDHYKPISPLINEIINDLEKSDFKSNI